MKPSHNRYLLFRFYLLLAAGLIAMAALLDYGFGVYGEQSPAQEHPWLLRTLALIEEDLSEGQRAIVDRSESGLAERARRLSEILSVDVQLYSADRFASPLPVGELQAGTRDDGVDVYLYALRNGLVVELTSTDEAVAWSLREFMPVLFYAAILIVVGIWFAPLVRDLNRLGSSASKFASDYKAPLPELDQVTQLTDLAGTMAAMAERIRGLIATQQDLTNALSHEIRTPLARMKFALAVAKDSKPGSGERVEDDLAKDIGEIDSLISAMLDYARLDRFDVQANWQSLDLQKVLAPFVAKDAAGVSVELVSSPAIDPQHEGVEVYASGDPDLLHLAVSNLVVNASRYANRVVELQCQTDAFGWAVIRVDDDGAGVAEQDREIIFEAFSRPDASRSKKTGGFGLGLAIVTRIARMHGGCIKVADSALGGASFELRWPVVQPEKVS